MAIWPFGRKKHDRPAPGADTADEQAAPPQEPQDPQGRTGDDPAAGQQTVASGTAAQAAPGEAAHQDAAVQDATARDAAVTGGAAGAAATGTAETGPFDGDTVAIEEFDFSDFSAGILNLGSLKLPLPRESQVQVEMGEQGPRMLHVVTRHGRITPVAFAAPRSGGQWRQTVTEIAEKMREDGLDPQVEDGPWAREITAAVDGGQLRIIGADGPRWMLRFTTAAPAGHEQQLTEQARELFARTFVYRGDTPVLAGNSLPVAIPQQLAEQLQQAMAERARQQQAGQAGQTNQPGGGQAGPAKA